jgi:hypothetical protein
MKLVIKLLLTLSIMLIASVASADVIGVYNDDAGTNCTLNPGFTSNAAVLHKMTLGTVAANFKIVLPPGSSFFSFSTPFSPLPGVTPEGNISVQYGGCLTGTIVVGHIVAILAAGTIQVLPADGGIGYIQSIRCDLTSRYVYPSNAGVGQNGDCDTSVSTEASTWGSVKALYR